MERDIILEALYRFRDIVDPEWPHAFVPCAMLESDKRLARLAIKKYNKTLEWRAHRPPRRSDEREMAT